MSFLLNKNINKENDSNSDQLLQKTSNHIRVGIVCDRSF